MKLSEALINRANYSKKIEELKNRIIRNAKYQEGDEPAENPNELLKEYQDVLLLLEEIIIKINLTNNVTVLENGLKMVEALAKKDMLKFKHSLYTDLIKEATPKEQRYSKTEIKFVSSVNIKYMQKEADEIAKEYRELDTLIQQTNWNTDLI